MEVTVVNLSTVEIQEDERPGARRFTKINGTWYYRSSVNDDLMRHYDQRMLDKLLEQHHEIARLKSSLSSLRAATNT